MHCLPSRLVTDKQLVKLDAYQLEIQWFWGVTLW